MKLAIISDTHDNWANIDKVLAYLKNEKAEAMIHCGDVCAPITMVRIAEAFPGPIYLSLGNVDGDPFRMLTKIQDGSAKNVTIYQEIGEFTLDNKKIAINHYPDIAKKLAQSGEYDLVFYGHNHKPWEETIGSTRMINPGNVANMVYPPTFALYDTATNELTLIRVNDL
ncbi:MAG: YfcE family phosphodiesterase [Candidatus Kerfeldbacteria bacterium]|nr:YfcE family phosphodiesterase [Candidatus Kerfeldbacteria bacterium]